MEIDRRTVARALADAGCVAPDEEAEALLRASRSGRGSLDAMLARRERGEPLAWVVGSIDFCGIEVRVDSEVYVPRPQTEPLARRAAQVLPTGGVGVDLCTGSGAVAAVMGVGAPEATILATDCDPTAIACATSNGVHAILGDLDGPLDASLEGAVDVMTAVVPYVPTEEVHLLPRDVLAYEPRRALDGGPRGTAFLERVAVRSTRWLRPGGCLLLELGGDQARPLGRALEAAGLARVRVHRDADGRDRAIEAWKDPDRNA